MNNVGFRIDIVWIEFGYSETLYSFFSTVYNCLENKDWGSRFPILMNNLYYDEENGIKYEDINKFKEELLIIEKEFSTLKIDNAIWSFEDKIYDIPKNKPNINYKSTTLIDYYQNNYDKNIFEVFKMVLEHMDCFNANCKITIEP